MARKILRKISAVLVSLIALILIVVLIGGNVVAGMYAQMISVFTGAPTYEVKGGANPQYFTSEFSSEEEMIEYEREVCRQVEQEGMVLLKNDNSALPLSSSAKITLLSQNAVELVYGGTGAGSVDISSSPNLKMALEAAGFEINPVLWDFYATGSGSAYRKEIPNIMGSGALAVHEVPASVYTENELNSFKEYNDAAVVVIGRSGGESNDLTIGTSGDGHYLQLSNDERDLLQMARENFDKVIVLLNIVNPMELGFLNSYDVDACLWVGAVGQEGAYAIGDALAGVINPSGRLVDTFAYSADSAPAMANLGDYTIVNSQVESGTKYLVYAEGIYVGYRYYETRYEDVVLGNEKEELFDYQTQVQFPFGYGLSYTDFEWSDYQVTEGSDTFEASVKVTNTGSTAGKETVQIYIQSPYTEYDKQNSIEKASAELVGFAKTDLLQPGASETVKISVDKESMKTYDALGYGTYIADAGDYYLAAGKNVHEALNHILAAKGKSITDGMDENGDAAFAWIYNQPAVDTEAYAVSGSTGKEITNQFGDADIRAIDPDFAYLSRSDWEGTWPETYAGGNWTAPDNLVKDLEITFTEDADAVMPAFDTINEEYGKLDLIDLKGAEFDDPRWEALLSQMSQEEISDLIRQGGYATIPVLSINAPGTVDKDGPAGISGTLAGGGAKCMAYPAEVVLASSWNLDISEEMGRMVGEDSISTGISMWYAPAMNIHRTVFSGRNFEYYSEDGFLSGKMGAAEVAGVQEKGAMVTIKHFAVNDQEINRMGGAMFASEQAIREIYLKGFELSVREGNANGVMTSMNRLGARWSGGHGGLMTDTLRDEWGFKGFAITDQASFPNFAYSDMREGLGAGTDLWLCTSSTLWKLDKEEMNATVMNDIRTAAHRVLYTIVNSNAMNGVDTDSEIVITTPGWRTGLTVVSVVLVALIGLLIFCAVKLFKKKKVK